MAITFEIAGVKDVRVQANDAIKRRQPTQTDTFKQPDWKNTRKYIDTVKLHMERTVGDVDIVYKASTDARLSIDYVKDQASVNFYYYEGISSIAFYEHTNDDYITSINLPKVGNRPVSFSLANLQYVGTSTVYYQTFYEFWKRAQDLGITLDAGDLTSAVVDHYDCNREIVGDVGLDQFDLNSGLIGVGTGEDNLETPAPSPEPGPSPTPEPGPSPTPAPASSPTTYTVTVQSVNIGGYTTANRYFIDGTQQATLSLTEGQTYKFDQSASSNATHPLRISTTSNGTHAGGSEYTTGVTTSGTAGSSGAYTQIVVPVGAPTLYYYCVNHSGMGGTLNT